MDRQKRGSNPLKLTRRRLGIAAIAALLALPGMPAIAQSQPDSQSDIIIRGPIIFPRPYPRYPQRRQRVRVRFIVEGDSWGSIYLDNRLLFSPRTFNRDEEFWLDQRAYHLEVQGATRFDRWDSGYLDVGRGDSGALIVVVSERSGVRVVGDPNAWLPDPVESRR